MALPCLILLIVLLRSFAASGYYCRHSVKCSILVSESAINMYVWKVVVGARSGVPRMPRNDVGYRNKQTFLVPFTVPIIMNEVCGLVSSKCVVPRCVRARR